MFWGLEPIYMQQPARELPNCQSIGSTASAGSFICRPSIEQLMNVGEQPCMASQNKASSCHVAQSKHTLVLELCLAAESCTACLELHLRAHGRLCHYNDNQMYLSLSFCCLASSAIVAMIGGLQKVIERTKHCQSTCTLTFHFHLHPHGRP